MTKIDFKNLFKRNKNPHYENVDDAYKKLPKRWVVNVVTLVVFVAIFIYFGFKTGFFTNVGFKDNDTISKITDEIINLVNQILVLKAENSSTDTSKLEKDIDNLIYKLYNLTPKEIEIIERR